jgi:hypothetical protein
MLVRTMETKQPRHYESKLRLHPMKFEDAVKAIAKAKPEPKTSKKSVTNR